MIDTVYIIEGIDGLGFVTNKIDCSRLALKHYKERFGDDVPVAVFIDTENDKVIITDEWEFSEVYYIQTIKRLKQRDQEATATMTQYYPIPYSVDDTWLLIHAWAGLIVVYGGRVKNVGRLLDVYPLAYQGKVAWLDGEIEVLEGDETAMPLDEIRHIFERSDV
jgi:hypothetical protein